jgi:6-phosphogluconate dehydrogenase (decarboxylating)
MITTKMLSAMRFGFGGHDEGKEKSQVHSTGSG